MKHKILIFLVLLTTIFSTSFADNHFRVMTYNSLNLSYSSYSERIEYFSTVLNYVQPDVLMMQEMRDPTAANKILETLGSEYSACQFVDGYGTDNMFYYRNSTVTLLWQEEIETDLRNIGEYVAEIGGQEVRFYSCHLKASQGQDNEQRRFLEASALRQHLDALPDYTEFIVVGDMNLYSNDEPAYQKFIEGGDGKFEDLAIAGNWHENYYYRHYHTQSTRTTSIGDGGASGGLDDRFDFIFASFGLNDDQGIEFLEGTYTTVGNDGNHFNASINQGTNAAVPIEVADALFYASDHLPVYADFIAISDTTSIPPTPEFADILYQNYPNPFNSQTTISYDLEEERFVTIKIYDIYGRFVKTIYEREPKGPGLHSDALWEGVDAQGKKVESGVYIYTLDIGKRNIEAKKMVLVR